MKKCLASLGALTMALMVVLTGCDSKPASSGASSGQAVNDAAKDIAGDYILDATPLGMPLQIYLNVGEDGSFRLSNQLTDGQDKGSGKIGKNGDTYMLLFSDSTTESPKTATFTVEGKQLVFSTKLPYGTSGFAPNTEDPENPIYPTAKAIAYKDVLGDYVGSHEETIAAMNATLTYSYTLTLSYGAEYTFVSEYTVMGQPQTYTQTGTFTVDGEKLSLTAKGESTAETGTITADKTITTKMLVSAQGKEKKDVTLKPATTGAYAGTYAGRKTMSMGMSMTADVSLVLDKLGGYTYTAKIAGEDGEYTESGTFAVDGTAITFTSSAEGAEPISGTLENDVVKAKFRISSAVPMATDLVFYSGRIQGTFTDTSTDGEHAGYTSTLVLSPDASYTITVVKDGKETYTEKGTFETAASPMGVSLVLKSEKGEISGVVSDASININHPVSTGDTTAVGFQYGK